MTIDLQRYRSILPASSDGIQADFTEYAAEFAESLEALQSEFKDEIRKAGDKPHWATITVCALARMMVDRLWSARTVGRHIAQHLFDVEDRLAELERQGGVTPPKPRLQWDDTSKQWRKAA